MVAAKDQFVIDMVFAGIVVVVLAVVVVVVCWGWVDILGYHQVLLLAVMAMLPRLVAAAVDQAFLLAREA